MASAYDTNTNYVSPYAQERNSARIGDINMQRAAISSTGILNKDHLPPDFPYALWEEQQGRYRHAWRWFTGEYLDEIRGKTPDGENVYKFPLKINVIRDFARKHAAMLFGEIPEHSSRPLVRCMFSPIVLESSDDNLDTIDLADRPVDPKKKEAQFYANVVNRVWHQSSGDGMLFENATLSQFLGGSYLSLNYVPWRKDLLIPIEIRNPKPDFVLPIWSNDNPWELLECYILYRMPGASARLQWGIDTDETTYVTYAEHWTKEHHSIYINGKPIEINIGGTKISYDKAENIFGFVPVFYLPRLRESGFYGSSIVPDIEGLTLEFNGRMADAGTAVMRTAHRRWFGRNIASNPRRKQFDNEWYTDLGMENPAVKNPPEIWPENPPQWSPALSQFTNDIWLQLLRQGSMTPVAFGEDEGSQRSALTLAIRFWPTSVVSRIQRIFWTSGLNHVALKLLIMLNKIGWKFGGRAFPENPGIEFDVAQDWLPMVARDREATVNEIILLSSTAIPRISVRRSLELLGDVPDIDEELEEIMRDMEVMSEYQQEIEADAETQVATPKASDGLEQE